MGYFLLIVSAILLVYFIIKKVRQIPQNLAFPELEVFGEITALDQAQKKVTVKTKDGPKIFQVKPPLFLQLGLEMRGVFTYQKDNLLAFTPYEKKGETETNN